MIRKPGLLTFLFVWISCICFAQYKEPKIPRADSSNYYEVQLMRMQRATIDSLRGTDAYRDLLAKAYQQKLNADRYTAFVLFTSMTNAEMGRFNANNKLSGFSAVSDNMISIGMGIASKRKRRMFEFTYFALGIPKNARKQDEKITISFSTGLQLEWGYDLIKDFRWNVFPFAGVGFRSTSIRYNGVSTLNPVFTNASNVFLNNTASSSEMSRLTYQAGIVAECVVTKMDKPGGALFFVKGGINNTFKKEVYDFDGMSYDPQINYGKWVVAAGFKFFGK